MSDYPAREQLFSLKFIQWLIDTEATLEVGPDAFALLVAVAMAEDRIRYSRAPNFFNEQICRQCGIASIPALIRARNRAVECGLLNYTPSTKRRPGTYFVIGFPNDSIGKAEGIRKESVRNPTPSIPIPIPIPKEKRSRFIPPTVPEVRAYCHERGNKIDPEHFHNHYEANGWIQGKGKPISNWKAAVRYWEGNGIQSHSSTNGSALNESDMIAAMKQKRKPK